MNWLKREKVVEVVAGLDEEAEERRRLLEEMRLLREEVRGLFELVGREEVASRLKEEGVVGEAVEKVAEAIRGADDPKGALSSLIKCAPRLEGKRAVAFVGPEGGGKTTTMAKVAANLAFGEGRRVGIVFANSRKVGGVEQAAVISSLLGVPFELARSGERVGEAMSRMRECEVILIDTPGVNPLRPGEVGRLQGLLEGVEGEVETHLVLPASGDPLWFVKALEGMKPVGYEKVILTKMDEAVRKGNIINAVVYGERPLSFICDGPEIPDAIAPAEPEALSSMVLKAIALGGEPSYEA
ncbi:MAG TPA: hypothetical protein EYP65_02325 [Armatimonadetes bacterium]|nr:hypothetical protein [Armatimonadota bacterium]